MNTSVVYINDFTPYSSSSRTIAQSRNISTVDCSAIVSVYVEAHVR